MKTNAPKQITLYIAVLLAALGLIGKLAAVAFLSTWAFWLLCAGFVLLLLGCLMEGL